MHGIVSNSGPPPSSARGTHEGRIVDCAFVRSRFGAEGQSKTTAARTAALCALLLERIDAALELVDTLAIESVGAQDFGDVPHGRRVSSRRVFVFFRCSLVSFTRPLRVFISPRSRAGFGAARRPCDRRLHRVPSIDEVVQRGATRSVGRIVSPCDDHPTGSHLGARDPEPASSKAQRHHRLNVADLISDSWTPHLNMATAGSPDFTMTDRDFVASPVEGLHVTV